MRNFKMRKTIEDNHMRTYLLKSLRPSTVIGVAGLLMCGASCQAPDRSLPAVATSTQTPPLSSQTPPLPKIVNTGAIIQLTAQRMTTTLRDGTAAPMWGYCEGASCTTAWAPGPTIIAAAGSSLTIKLTNNLPVPTSLVILGQTGGGVGTPATMASPAHSGQKTTTFAGNAPAGPFVPPAQGQRVRSFGSEAAAATTTGTTTTPGAATLIWSNLKPGTYLYETGSMPSLEVPMGLYGVLVVTTAPTSTTTGTAYPNVFYDSDATLLFSEIDPVQNRAVDAAAVARADVNMRFNDPACSAASPCYPAAVNYAPTYFLINGSYFDKTSPGNSAFLISGAASSGNVLVRMLNAGSRTHIPSIVGLPMVLVAEDGNLLPGAPKVQNEVLLTAGKAHDVLVRPPYAGSSYQPNTYPVFDRQLSLSTDNNPNGGMQGFLLVNSAAAQTKTLTTGTCPGTNLVACSSTAPCASGVACNFTVVPLAGAPGNLPVTATPTAVNDQFKVPCNATFSGDVTANDIGVANAAVFTPNTTALGTLAFNAGGTFTYVPTACSGGTDSFTYKGNNGTTNVATVTLNLGIYEAQPPVANSDTYTSVFSTRFSVPRPGVLINDTDPGGYPITAGPATPINGCDSVVLNPDGSFSVTASPSAVVCTFNYMVTNSQGLTSNPLLQALVTVYFPLPSNLAVSVVDAATGAAITDYRWTLQEDLTFKHSLTGTPLVGTRTVGTSFHRSHMPVVATGCVGPMSCGSGQGVRIDNGTGGGPIASAVVDLLGTTVTVITSNPQSNPTPSQVAISGLLPAGYSGTFATTWLNGLTFTYTLPAAVVGPLVATGASYSTNVNGTFGGRHVVTDAEALALQTTPDQVALDPTKNYYISIIPGDAANPVTQTGTCSASPLLTCSPALPCPATAGTCNPGGHTVTGTEVKRINAAWAPVTVKAQANPLTPAQMSIYIYEDTDPTNGVNEASEPPLGGFTIILLDPAGRTGDVAGQNTYDVYNMPLSNSLLGRPGCPDTQNTGTNGSGNTAGSCSVTTTQACSTTATSGALLCPRGQTCVPSGNNAGEIYTCPNPTADDLAASKVRTCSLTPASCTAATAATDCQGVGNTCLTLAAKRAALDAKYALAGHALVKNVVPARYDVLAHPSAQREGAGEVWWQTETLEGTPAQDAFVGYNESQYFQEFGPPGPHVTIGFVNPARVAAANKTPGNKSITGKVTSQHMSHPSNVTLHDSTTYDLLSSTTCRVVLNSQAGLGPAIASAECAPDGTFNLTGIKEGSYDLAVFDQWLDQIIQNVAVTVPATILATTGCPFNTVCMGDIPVLSWFNQFDQYIFQDDGSHTYSASTPGISNVPLTVRFRNGAPSNRTLSDGNGNGILVELFPLFNWYVAEADTTRFKQSSVRIIVDGGGKPDVSGTCANLWTSKYASGEFSTRTETPATGMSLTYGLQGFISQRSRIEWGRVPYATGENGGITGTVVLASTRPFDDQRFDVQNIWEPLIPRVTVNLYQRQTLADGTVTLKLVDSTKTSSFDDFANTVWGSDNNKYVMGPNYDETARAGLRFPDGTVDQFGVDISGTPAPPRAYPAGAQANMQCPGQLPGTTIFPWNTTTNDPFTNYTLGNDRYRCYDGWHDWNQVQAAPYDGRYNFPSPAYQAAHSLCPANGPQPANCTPPAVNQTLVSLPIGTYVVEAVTPPGYAIVKEEDKDILIGDTFIAPVTQQFGSLSNIFIIPDQATIGNANPYNPSTGDPGFQSNPTSNLGNGTSSRNTVFPECVGNLHRVPDYLSLFVQAQLVAPFAGMDRPLCDRKRVVLNDQMQSSANFFLYTEAPVAANNTGIVLDDASSEFNAVSPDFGEKASVPFVPVSVKDFSGVEINRTYTDQWGAYNMMTYTSWLVNPPTPSGYGPSMLVTCINDPGPIPDPNRTHPGSCSVNTTQSCSLTGTNTCPSGETCTARLITDPNFNPAYSNFCYTNPYMPGQTTYLDTPVLPVAAFASGYNPPDCALPDAAPVVKRIDSSAGFGPWLPATGGTLTITAKGDQQVPNPAYAGPFAATGLASQITIMRHYGFGPGPTTTNGAKVTVGTTTLACPVWTDQQITCTVPAGTATGELEITTAAGQKSVDTVTVTIEGITQPTRVSGGFTGQTDVAAPGPIQLAVDAATPGDLILIDAGVYNELVVMWKPVRLQGVGAGSVIINAAKYPTSKLEVWRPRINALFSVDPVTGTQTLPSQVDPLPTQEITGGVVILEPTVLGSEEGAGITVLAKNVPDVNSIHQCTGGVTSTYGRPVTESNFLCGASRIDGISVTGGDAGGGIYVNGWAHNLQISNNRVYGNAGAFNGGIRVGVPYLELTSLPLGPVGTGFGFDKNIRIHHNQVTKNGTVEGPGLGGGAGAGVSVCTGTDNYEVDHNWICANNGQSDGGGIGHLGFSQGGKIDNNQILFNQSFQQTGSTHGGGIFVGGESPTPGALSLGTGNLTIDSNLIRGNFAEGGHGGGIRLQRVNGADVRASMNPLSWHHVTISKNMIDNNVAGWAGGGISLADALSVSITDNTVDSNDSTGIAGVLLVSNVAAPRPGPNGTFGAGIPSPAGIVSEPTSTQLFLQVPGLLRTAAAISQPLPFTGNVIWQNRSFYYSGNGQICSGNTVPTSGCSILDPQSTSGSCNKADANAAQPKAKYWEIGVLGDANPTPPAPLSNLRLYPLASVMSNITGYLGNTSTLTGSQITSMQEYCNGSRVLPEVPAVLNPPSVKNLQVAATVDEGNNYVNLRYGPLYVENPANKTTFGPLGPPAP